MLVMEIGSCEHVRELYIGSGISDNYYAKDIECATSEDASAITDIIGNTFARAKFLGSKFNPD